MAKEKGTVEKENMEEKRCLGGKFELLLQETRTASLSIYGNMPKRARAKVARQEHALLRSELQMRERKYIKKLVIVTCRMWKN